MERRGFLEEVAGLTLGRGFPTEVGSLTPPLEPGLAWDHVTQAGQQKCRYVSPEAVSAKAAGLRHRSLEHRRLKPQPSPDSTPQWRRYTWMLAGGPSQAQLCRRFWKRNDLGVSDVLTSTLKTTM